MALLSLLDAHFISHAYHNTLIKGPSVQLVFGFEYAVLLTAVVHVFVKYVLHTVDLQSDNPWENKAVYLLYTEVFLGGVKVAFYILFLAIMIKVHTFPLFIIRPMYLSVREFKKALNDVVMSRRAIRNMNTLYANATVEELSAGDNVCIICREEMRTLCKKLPCNHIFHTSCLRSWFQRQQTCPTCRMDVLRLPVTSSNQIPPVQQPLPPPLIGPVAAHQFQGVFPAVPPNFVMPQVHYSSATVPVTVTEDAYQNQFVMPPQYPWPFTFPPMPPSNFSGLSSDDLRYMQGNERQNIEARFQCLSDIQTLLNAALLLLHQYVTAVAASNVNHQDEMNSANLLSSGLTTSTVQTPDTYTGITADNVASMDTTVHQDSAAGVSQDQEELAANMIDTECDGTKDDSKINEIRRRRLEHFSSSNLSALDKSE
jgi:E3 ubiquitin-protein ligase synoviolin